MRNKIVWLVSKMIMRTFLVLEMFLLWNCLGGAADFKGATEVLRLASESPAKPKQNGDDPNAVFRQKIKAFGSSSTNLTSAEAAKQWLTLVEDFQSELAKSAVEAQIPRREGLGLRFEEIMDVLPPPAYWADLEKAVESRSSAVAKGHQKRELGLRLIVYTLTQNTAKRGETFKALEALAKKSDGPQSGYEFMAVFETLNEAILATMDDPEAILRMLESQLARSGDSPSPLRVPNLVALVGSEKAEAFFRKEFKTSTLIQVEPGTPTHKLATKTALEMVGQMPKPQWGLVNSLDSVDLFEALAKKFKPAKEEREEPSATNNSFFNIQQSRGMREDDQEAKLYYFLGLIARDRVRDAMTVARSLDRNNSVYFPPGVIKEMERAGLAEQLNNFFSALLTENPDVPFWSEYVRVAAHAGHADDALKLVRTTLAKPDIGASRRAELKALLPSALLANDEIEAGIAELRRSLTNQEPAAARASYGSYYFYSSSDNGERGLQIARIGKLLDQPDWVQEGVLGAKANLEKPGEDKSFSWRAPEVELADFLSSIGRGGEAEEVLTKALNKAVQKNGNDPRNIRSWAHTGGSQEPAAAVLAELVKVYYTAGRFQDVVSLLDDAQYWGAKDLIEVERNGLLDGYGPGAHTIKTPLGFYAAASLAKTDRKAEAAKILKQLFEQSPGLDRLYELLLELDPTNALTRLDQLFARDPFEERPLIWKAHWLRTHGKLEEAEQAARKAIAIDPSDGEEGPGDRMRAYAELAEIRAARGDAKEAEFFRGAVAAIRESETADQLHEAGLLKRAVKIYEDSLTHFADAYCIQSRLAIQLSDLGLHELAEEHYQRAYELMPSSFGRVESHCFGCERAFEGERAQSIAEKVFTRLAQATPDKPQVYYLLGYLREEQERPREALDYYRQAVKLDADYLNAWQKMQEISSKTVVPSAERDTVTFNLLRLDPNHRHVSYTFQAVSDLAELWRRVAAIRPGATAAAKTLYPLKASKRKLEETPSQPDQSEEMMLLESNYQIRDEKGPASPAQAVAQNGFIRAGMGLIANSIADLE